MGRSTDGVSSLNPTSNNPGAPSRSASGAITPEAASRLRAISGISLASRSRRTGPSAAIARPAASAALRVESQASSGDPSSPDADVTRNSPVGPACSTTETCASSARCASSCSADVSASDPRTRATSRMASAATALASTSVAMVRCADSTPRAVRTLLWSRSSLRTACGNVQGRASRALFGVLNCHKQSHSSSLDGQTNRTQRARSAGMRRYSPRGGGSGHGEAFWPADRRCGSSSAGGRVRRHGAVERQRGDRDIVVCGLGVGDANCTISAGTLAFGRTIRS